MTHDSISAAPTLAQLAAHALMLQGVLEEHSGRLSLFQNRLAEPKEHALIFRKGCRIVQPVLGDSDELIRAHAGSLGDGDMLFPFIGHVLMRRDQQNHQLLMIVGDGQVFEHGVRQIHDRNESPGAVTQHPEEIDLRGQALEPVANGLRQL